MIREKETNEIKENHYISSIYNKKKDIIRDINLI